MADFSTNDMKRESVPANATPVAPVQKGANPFLGLAATVAEEGLKFLKEEDSNSVVGQFNKELDKINQAVEQGTLSPTAGARKARSLTSSRLAEHGKYTKELTQSFNAFKGTTQLGESIEQEQREQDQLALLQTEAAKEGWIVEGMNEEEKSSQTQAYFENKKLQEELSLQMRMNAEKRAQGQYDMSISKAERAAQELANKRRIQSIVESQASTNYTRYKNFLSVATRKFGEMGPASADQFRSESAVFLANLERQASEFSSTLSSDEIDRKLKPFRDLHTNFEKVLSGQFDATAYKSQVDAITSSAQLSILHSDPKAARLFAGIKTFGQIPGISDILINSKATSDFISGIFNEDPAPANPFTGTSDERATSFRTLKQTINNLQDEDRPALEKGINEMLEGFDAYSSFSDDPERFAQVSNFLASPEFAKLVNDGMISESSAIQAQRTISREYDDAVLRSARNRITEVFKTFSGKKIPMEELMNIEFNGSAVTVQPTEKLINVKDRGVRDSLIRQLKPALNAMSQSIQIGAHLNNSTDYKKQWEDNKHRYFPNFYPRPDASTTGQVRSTENAEINAQIDSGEAQEVSIEQVEQMSDEELLAMMKNLTGSQRSKLLQEAGFLNE